MTDETAAPDSTAPRGSIYDDDLFCPECGYSLRGLTSDRCPECGLLLDFIESEVSLIPWVSRRRRGAVRSFVKTVAAVVFRKRRFCRAIASPVTYADAQRFRWTTIAVVMATVLSLELYAIIDLETQRQLESLFVRPGITIPDIVYACVPVALLVILIILTGVPSYLFHPRYLSVGQQNRAVAMSYYACAPLALLPVVLAVVQAAMVPGRHGFVVTFAGGALVGGSLVVVVLLYWLTLIGFARRTLRRASSVWRVALCVPLIWLIAGLILLGIVPGAVLYGGFLLHSCF